MSTRCSGCEDDDDMAELLIPICGRRYGGGPNAHRRVCWSARTGFFRHALALLRDESGRELVDLASNSERLCSFLTGHVILNA